MTTERELLAMCLRWIEYPQGDAFDKAMLLDAVRAKLAPRPWIGLTQEEQEFCLDSGTDGWRGVLRTAEALLKEKNQ
jgi:hypothetical protein